MTTTLVQCVRAKLTPPFKTSKLLNELINLNEILYTIGSNLWLQLLILSFYSRINNKIKNDHSKKSGSFTVRPLGDFEVIIEASETFGGH